jgi:hypothetical protein
MTTLRIKIKLGEHEFEADGPPDAVEAQVRTFVRLIGREEKTEAKPAEIPPPPPITKVARINGKVVSLNVPCQSLEQAVMAVLLGQRQLRGNPFVAGTEIMAGLRASGHRVERADNILKRQAMLGNVVVTGKRRLKRYRLTTDGAERAQKIAQALAASAQQASKPQDVSPVPRPPDSV